MNPQATLSWNRFYCVMMACIQFAILSILICIYFVIIEKGELSRSEGEFLGHISWLLFTFQFPLICGGVLSTTLAFAPKTKYWWWAHLFHQIMGLGSCIFFAVPLIIFWSREPLMEIYFGRKRATRRRRQRASR